MKELTFEIFCEKALKWDPRLTTDQIKSLYDGLPGDEDRNGVNEWDAIPAQEMWEEIQAIRKLTDNDGTMSPRRSAELLVEQLIEAEERKGVTEGGLLTREWLAQYIKQDPDAITGILTRHTQGLEAKELEVNAGWARILRNANETIGILHTELDSARREIVDIGTGSGIEIAELYEQLDSVRIQLEGARKTPDRKASVLALAEKLLCSYIIQGAGVDYVNAVEGQRGHPLVHVDQNNMEAIWRIARQFIESGDAVDRAFEGK
jgi:hypothetical protein